ncbi:MAG TPA: DUF1634 domain-containing protein [Longimicrobiaceae bacterium]|nr:DUF1634 domain-containing protein [Longimicrobiaceae bacterium]
MRFLQRRWTDEEVEQWVGGLLRAGVLLAAAVALLGGVLVVWHHASAPVDFSVFRGERSGLRSVGGIVRGALAGDGHAVVQLGLLLLIATPVARVALSLVAFAVQRDRLYIAVTAVVLALLLYGLFGSGA